MTLSRVINSSWYLTLFLLVVHTFFIFKYSVHEFHRPYVYVAFPVSAFVLVLAFASKLINGADFSSLYSLGISLGFSASLLILISNYSINNPSKQNFEVVRVAEGWGNSTNWKIRFESSRYIKLNMHGIELDDKPENIRINLRVGIWGFYYGDWEKID